MSDHLLVTLEQRLRQTRASRTRLFAYLTELRDEISHIKVELAEIDAIFRNTEAAVKRLKPTTPLSLAAAKRRSALKNQRFRDRTIPEAAVVILREEAGPLHVNEIHRRLVDGGFTFVGDHPTISISVALNRNQRFRKTAPGTFDLVIREATQAS